MFDPEKAVLICADSWDKLRKGDVYRLFDSHEESQWRGIYRCLIKHRPEFAFEAREVMADLEADASSFYGDIPGTTI